MQAKDVLQSLAEKADIRINGNRPWDVQVHNENLYRRVLGQGTLGLGEAIWTAGGTASGWTS